MPSGPHVLGITGGIGSGKSTLCQILVEEYQVPLIDADRLGHEALLPGSAVFEAVVARFGEEVIGASGAIDRPQLARRVFADAAELAALEGIVHPWIFERIQARTAALKASGYAGMILLDAALLLEWRARYRPEGTVVVVAPLDVRLDRLTRRGMSREEAGRRIAHQRPESEWTADADWIVENGGTLDDLVRSAKSLWVRVSQRWDLSRSDGE